MLAAIRAFFASRGVLEVETPALSAHGTVDRHIDSFAASEGRWLHTSPEFAMKRLLAAGSGPVYQIARVFRREEDGRHHNPEFTLLEWYRPGFDHHRLMDELAEVLQALIPGLPTPARQSYREAFVVHAGLDPFAASEDVLCNRCLQAGVDLPSPAGDTSADRDFHLDILMSRVVGPALGQPDPTFLYDFPASQAALARIRAEVPPLAERFELFWKGIELANGFHELTDAEEQRRRFELDRAARLAQGKPTPACDEHLIDALAAGLPACAGVAVGLDRLLMLMLGLADVRDTLAFDWARA